MAIQHQGKRRSRMTMLGDHCGSVCVVMLDSDQRAAIGFRKPGRSHIRMQIMGHGDRLYIKARCKVSDRLLERADALGRIQIANMLGDERLVVPRDGDGRFQCSSDGEHGRHRLSQA